VYVNWYCDHVVQPWFSRGSALVQLWFSRGSAVAQPWFSRGSAVVQPWFSRGSAFMHEDNQELEERLGDNLPRVWRIICVTRQKVRNS